MQTVVIDKPYRFVPPYDSLVWTRILQSLLRWRLKVEHGVVDVICRGQDRLQASVRAGHGVLLAPNHCRPSDPYVLGEATRQAGVSPHAMASWHVFMQGRLQAFLMRRAGVFSVYREGMDRAAVTAAVDILATARRPLVIFPEGVISRSNERLNPLMEGTSLIARAAARERAKAKPPGRVVVHAVGVRYFYMGDIEQALAPTLTEIEHRLAWRPQSQLSLVERISKLGMALLTLKEIELVGAPQSGNVAARLARLIDHLLLPLEREWLGDDARPVESVIVRVKRLRTAILPDMVQGDVPETERERRWRQLADLYLAQQLWCYPPDYLRENPSSERLLETVERYEEDLTDRCRPYPPLIAVVEYGPAIAVDPERVRGEDPVISAVEADLNRLIASMPRPADART